VVSTLNSRESWLQLVSLRSLLYFFINISRLFVK
jgi:hypothetical protein